jgi:hypothetical protein
MRRSDLGRTAALGTALAALLATSPAGAYCRTSSCDPQSPSAHTGAECNPPQPDDCGTPIVWPQSCVEYSVQENASRKITFAETEQVMKTAFGTWMAAACPGGGHPDMLVTEGTPAICALHEYNQTAGNANIILYHDDSWPYEGSANTLALTTVTYNLDTGAIYDADMELNTFGVNFTLGDNNVDFDLLSVVTHETGHFLGLAHSHDLAATMWPVYNEHTTSLRNLSPDDIAGICAIYPPGPPTPGCDPTPRHGFSPLCGADQPQTVKGCGGCALPGDDRAIPAGAIAAVGALILAVRRRRAAVSRR